MKTQEQLSKQQSIILLWLLKSIEKLERRTDTAAQTLLCEGIPWKVVASKSSRRVSICRALVRLERRGLIERVAPKGRTKAVRMTESGRVIAQQFKAAKASY
jgi:predicted transcriptional regulator of viral defense system